MVIGVVVTVTATVTDCPCASWTFTCAVPAATASKTIVVVHGEPDAVTGEVTVTELVLSDETV